METKPPPLPARKTFLAILIPILWILLVLAGYYYVHKPVDAGSIAGILAVLADLAIGLGILLLAGGVGRRIARFETLSPLEKIAVQAALGLLILGFVLFLLGILHLYYRLVFWIFFCGGCVVFRREIFSWLRDVSSISREWNTSRKLQRFLVVCIVTFAGIQLAIALAIPVKWDALTYHLDLPRHYLAANALVYLPQNPYWGHPQTAEMINTLAMGLFRQQTAAVTCWGAGMLFLVGMLGFARRFYDPLTSPEQSREGAWITVAALMAGYTIRYLLGWAYSDLLAALLGLSTVIFFFQWLEANQPTDFLRAVIFASGATTIKWTEGVLLAGMLLCLPFLHKKNSVTWKLLLQSAVAAILVVAPWLLKNWIATGNPLFPFFLPTTFFSAARLQAANLGNAGINIWKSLLLPFSITFTGVDTAAGFSTDPGPLLLLLGLPGLILLRKHRSARVLAVLLLPAALALGVLSYRVAHLIQPRLYFALLPVAALPAGWGWIVLQGKSYGQIRLRNLLGTVIITVLLINLLQDAHTFFVNNPVQTFFQPEQTQTYFRATTGPYADAVQQVNILEEDTKLLMLWEPRGLYMPLDAQPDLWIDRFQTDIREQHTPEGVIQQWCREGYTHVLVYRLGESLLQDESRDAYIALVQLLKEHEPAGSMHDLYSIPCQ